MASTNTENPRGPAGGALLGAALSGFGLGIVFLLLPLVPSLRSAGEGFRIPALIALAVGALSLALHALLRIKQRQAPSARQEPEWTPSVQQGAPAPKGPPR
jgi:hypothetical protein